MAEDTLLKFLKKNYERHGNKVAQRRKQFGAWYEYAWKDFYEKVKYFCYGLLSLGLEPGDKVAIIGSNDPEWYWADLAAQAAGGVPVGLFTDALPSEIKYIFNHSDSKFAVVRDQEQVDKFLSLKGELPYLKKIIYWEPKGLWSYEEPLLISFEEVTELGKKYEESHPVVFEQNIDRGRGEDAAFLGYTSGTTALPKGVVVSHRNLLSCVRNLLSIESLSGGDQYVSVIAPAWIPEQWFGMTLPLVRGMIVNFPESPDTAQSDRREIAPQIIPSPPRGWETIASKIQAFITDAGFLKRFLYHLCLPIGYKVADLNYERKKPSLFWKILYKLAYDITFRPLKDKIGLVNLKSGPTSGGFLASTVFRFFRALGINIRQAYALTEGGLITYHREAGIKYETTGEPVPEAEIRISEAGEILTRSDMVVSGYWKDPKGTSERLERGWLHTGDAGSVDGDGHLIVIDRLVDLVELPGGGKFSPSYIESRLRFSPYIREAIAVGGGDRSYVTAIVSIDFDNVSRWAEAKKITYTTLVDLSQKPEVAGLILDEIKKLNRILPDTSKVKRFVNLHKELDADDAELTRTQKLKRSYAGTQYESLINALYSESREFTVEAEVKYRDGRKGVVKTNLNIVTME